MTPHNRVPTALENLTTDQLAKLTADQLQEYAATVQGKATTGPKNTTANTSTGKGTDPTTPDAGPPVLGQVYRRSDLAKLPKPRHLVAGVLDQPAAALLVGPYGVGKSFLALSMACAVSTGTPWLDHAVSRTNVLYVVGEGAYGLDARITAWERTWKTPTNDDALHIAVQPRSLAKNETWEALADYAQRHRIGFVVLDTFSSLAPDCDETHDAPRIMRILSDLSTAINGTALLVHHPGHADRDRARGAYAFEANADQVLILSGVADSDLIELKRKKVKDGPAGDALWLRRRPLNGSVIIESARPDDAAVPMRQRILAVLDGYGDIGATGPQVAKELGVGEADRSTFYRTLRKLIEDGEAIERGKGNARRYCLATARKET